MKKHLFSAILTLGVVSFLQAQTQEREKEIDSIVVTGSRMLLQPKQLPQKIEVISSKDIELTMASDITDYLKKLTSVNIIQYPHGFSYANVRGFAPNTFHGSNSIQPETSLLINGRPAGTVNMAVIDRNSIERMEVLKGPAAAMYGANTMGGVINIITRKTTGAIGGKGYLGYGSWDTAEAGVNVGGNLTQKLDFDFSGSFFNRGSNYKIGKNNWLRNAFDWQKSTITALDGTTYQTDDSVYDGIVRDFTKMQYVSSLLRVGYQFSKDWRVDVLGENYTTTLLNSLGDMRTVNRDRGQRLYNTGEISLTGKVNKHHIAAKAYISNEKSRTNTYFNAATLKEVPEYMSYQSSVDFWGLQLKDEYKLNSNIRFLLGADYNDSKTELRYWNAPTVATGNIPQERAASSPNGSIKNLGIYAQTHLTLFNNLLIVNPSFRVDFINYSMTKSFGLESRTAIRDEKKTMYSPNLGLQLNVNKYISLHGNIGKAFRYSVANQLAGYYEAFTTTKPAQINLTLGNPDLKDENSLTWDAGIKISNPKKGYHFDVTYFQTKVNDKIITKQDPTKVGTLWTALDGNQYKIASYQSYINSNYSKISGLEFDGYYDFGVFNHFKKSYKVFFNATKMFEYDDYIANINPALPDTSSKSRHVADLSFGGGFEYDDFKNWNFRISTRYVGKRNYVNFNDTTSPTKYRSQPVEYPPYMTVDVVVGYTFYKHHNFSLRVSNLTDENYYELRYQPMPGRFSSLRYTYKF